MNTTLDVSTFSALPLVSDIAARMPGVPSVDSLIASLKDIAGPDSVIGPNRRGFVTKALLIVYAGQTETEKCSGATIQRNGRGFNGRDAGFGSSLAQWAEKRELSDKQIRSAAKMLGRYSKQIVAGWY